MKIGLRPVEGENRFAEAIEQTKIAEDMGYDSVFFGEHHGFKVYWASPLVILSALSQVTSRILLGSNIMLLPLYSSLRVAEEAAMVDHLSGGRLILGLAEGWNALEYEEFAVEMKDRSEILEQGIEDIRSYWHNAQDSKQYRGPAGDSLRISPGPLQSPSPPIWLGGRSRKAIDRAARLGTGWVPPGNATLEQLTNGAALYRRLWNEYGHPGVGEIATTRHIVLAESYEAAWELAELTIIRWRAEHLQKGSPLERESRDVTLKDFGKDRYIVGDPDELARWIAELEALQIQHLILKFPTRHDTEVLVKGMKLAMQVVGR